MHSTHNIPFSNVLFVRADRAYVFPQAELLSQRCVGEWVVCGGVGGVWGSVWCVEEWVVCGGVGGVWGRGWCVGEGVVCGGGGAFASYEHPSLLA